MTENDTKRTSGQDEDGFWELDVMLPQKKKALPFAKNTETVAITVAPAKDVDSGAIPIPPPDPQRLARARRVMEAAERRFSRHGTQTPPSAQRSTLFDEREAEYLQAQRKRDELEAQYRQGKEEPIPPKPASAASSAVLTAYQPPSNPLLTQITVYRISPQGAPDRIRDQALAAFHASPPPSEPQAVPYHAAIPGYDGMTAGQRDCYLWWREQARNGAYPPIDSAYVYLYAYETLNLLPAPVEPSLALDTLCSLWAAYRDAEPRLDYLVPEWICDLCLVYRLSLPAFFPEDLLEIAVRVASLKEFYLGFSGGDTASPFARAVFRYGSNYRFQDSKFITEENRSLFETHIPAAFLRAFTKLEEEEKDSTTLGICTKRSFQARMIRQSFAGSAFARSIKMRIEVDYLSCNRSVELRFMATDLIKYAENQVRRLLGIKSRFHTAHLDPRLKAAADEYFAPLFPKMNKKQEAPIKEPPAYEALYDAPSAPFSPDTAKRIEQSAWAVTQKLVEAFDEEASPALPEQAPPQDFPAVTKEASASAPQEEMAQDALLRTAFALLMEEKDAEFAVLAKAHEMLPLTLAEKMNDCALDALGDIAVTEMDGVPRLIPDYKEDIAQWMNL